MTSTIIQLASRRLWSHFSGSFLLIRCHSLSYFAFQRRFNLQYLRQMPPKRAASTKGATAERPAAKRAGSSNKRKAESSDSEDTGPGASTSKKAKVTKSDATEGGVSANGQPTNKVLPVNIQFSPKHEGALRIATWNICGLAAASKKVSSLIDCLYFNAGAYIRKGFKYYVEAEDADILILTETKVRKTC